MDRDHDTQISIYLIGVETALAAQPFTIQKRTNSIVVIKGE